MKFQFDPSQEHQLRAIGAVTGLFAGQSGRMSASDIMAGAGSLMATVPVCANELHLSDDELLQNLRAVQELHNQSADSKMEPDNALRKIAYAFPNSPAGGLVAGKDVAFPNFSVEMETGTGKTYVFLRTIRELARDCGFLKFIAVVPTVAVRENILHSLASTDSHLEKKCRQRCEWARYDSSDLIRVRDYAAAQSARVLVMTKASFDKELNVIHRDADELSGDTPLRLIQATRPILILDEPQNMESDLSRESLALLNPLFALRFSATHRDAYNQVYRFTPADAYRRGLVKKIQVATVTAENPDAPLVRLIKVVQSKHGVLKARLALNVHTSEGEVAEKTKVFMQHEDLGEKSRLPAYKDILVDDICINPPWVRLTDGRTVREGEEVGGASPEILRAKISIALDEHFRRQRILRERGVKVLSLFFIDRVENYLAAEGEIRKAFESVFDEMKKKHPEWADIPAAEVHNGYFAVSKQGNSEQDVKAYDLIMRDKESLLTFAGPDDDEETRRKRRVAFIFSHSALREGWDNPNIMQICALRTGGSIMRRRQEVGRGLRLCVNQQGKRVSDGEANSLTVVASEDFADYARGYQTEIAEEYRDMIEARLGKPLERLTDEERAQLSETYGKGIIPPPPKRMERKTARATQLLRGKDGRVEFSPEFRALWEHISQKTTYRVKVDSAELIRNVVRQLESESAPPPQIRTVKGQLKLDDDGGFSAVLASGMRTVADLERHSPLPNIVDLILRLLKNGNPPLHLTRRTVFEIFRQAADDSALKNPTGWAAMAARAIRNELGEMATDGVEYRRIENKFYDWEQWFLREEREIAAALVAELGKHKDKAPYDIVECDVPGERQFAKDLAGRGDVKLFLKLPREFKVPTPVGNYNPDWAVVLTDEDGRDRVYFVAETKAAMTEGGAIRWKDLRGGERGKVRCAARHFGSKQLKQDGALEGVDYQVVKTARELGPRGE